MTRSLLIPLNALDSSLSILPHPSRRRSLPAISFPSTQPTPQRLQFRRRISPTAAAAARRSPDPTAAMDAVSVTPPESEFVSIDGPGSPVREDPGADSEGLFRSVSSVDDDDEERGEEERGGGDTALAAEDFGEGYEEDRREEERGGDDTAVAEEDRREVVPEEVWRNVVRLSCESTAEGGICEVYLVGTAHVSQESCQEVEAVIRFLKPQAVFLELCSSRMAVLTPQNLKVPTMEVMVDMWKKQHNMFGILYSWFLAKVASKLEVFPGSEFRVAFEEALKYGGKVILGDRPVQITLRRAWAKMPLWHKTKLLFSLVFQAFFLPSPEDLNKMLKEMDDVDMLTLVIQEMSKQFPTLMETLVHERDQYMSATLLRVAGENSSVVAVVGKGHLQGIKKNWKQPVEMKHLMCVDMASRKPAISAGKILTTVGVAVAGVAIISGIYLSTKK